MGDIVRVVIVCLFLCMIFVLAIFAPISDIFQAFLDYITTLDIILGSFLFILVYIIIVITMLPAVVLTLSSGYIFGLCQGCIVSFLGGLAGAVSAYLIGKLLLRSYVHQLSLHSQSFQVINQAIGNSGGKIVLLLRLSPLVPYNMLNYLLSITSIDLLTYTWASAVGMIPGSVLYVYLGSVARELSDIIVGQNGMSFWQQCIYMMVGISITLLSAWLINQITAKEIEKIVEKQRRKDDEEMSPNAHRLSLSYSNGGMDAPIIVVEPQRIHI